MNTHASAARLEALTKQLLQRWELTKDSWRDAKAEEFERKYMQELLANVETSVSIIKQIDKVISKVRSDCE